MAQGNRNHKWQEEVTAEAEQNSEPIYIPGWLKNITATVIPSGTAVLYHTTATIEDVEADPDAVQWVAWEPGSVATATSRSAVGAVTAVRVAASGGSARLEVVGER